MDHRVALLPAPAAFAGLLAVVACSSAKTSVADEPDASTSIPEPIVEAGIEDTYVPPPAVDAGPDPLVGCTKDPGAPAVVVNPNSATDPVAGGAAAFTLGTKESIVHASARLKNPRRNFIFASMMRFSYARQR